MVGACPGGIDLVDQRVRGGHVPEDTFGHGGSACWLVGSGLVIVRGHTDVAEADEEDINGAIGGGIFGGHFVSVGSRVEGGEI